MFSGFPSPTPIFPAVPAIYPGWSVHKIPTFATNIGIHVDGRESRSYRQAFPLWEFHLTYEILREQTQNQQLWQPTEPYTELEAISQLFLSCQGSYGEFFYDDPDDDSRLGASQLTQTNGTQTQWRVYRNWGSGSLTFYEPLGAINLTQPINVYLNGVIVSPTDYTVTNTLSGVYLNFLTAPAANQNVTMDFFFYYRCHFIEDAQDYEEFYKNLWTFKSCKFRSLKP